MIDDIALLYTPIEQAVAELYSRRLKLSSTLPDNFFDPFFSYPCAFLSRQLATPNFELHRFVELANAHSLTPIVGEQPADKFTSGNPFKCALARLRFSNGFGRISSPRTATIKVADIKRADGRPLNEVQTYRGQSLVAFHHDLLSASALSTISTFDMSPWFRANGGLSARSLYATIFSTIADYAIIFETFLPCEHKFTSNVVIPAFEAAHRSRGLRPLICRLDPPESEGDSYWYQYPHELQEFVTSRFCMLDSKNTEG